MGLCIGSIAVSPDHSGILKSKIQWRGIYIKSEPGDGTGSTYNILYEDITIQSGSDFSV